MRYAAILEVRAAHAYRADGSCPEVELVPTGDTLSLLRRHRCLVRCAGGVARVLALVDNANVPRVPLAAGAALRFSIVPNLPELSPITDLSPLVALDVPLYSNLTMAPKATGDLVLANDSRPGARRLPGALAGVEIFLHPSGVGRAPPATVFNARLQPRAAYWAYYVITEQSLDPTKLILVDGATPRPGWPPIVFSPANRRSLDIANDSADTLGAQLVGGSSGKRCIRFVSDAQVLWREEARRQLNLLYKGGAVFNALPNPPPEQTSTVTFVGQNNKSSLVQAQFQIIRYVNRTLKP